MPKKIFIRLKLFIIWTHSHSTRLKIRILISNVTLNWGNKVFFVYPRELIFTTSKVYVKRLQKTLITFSSLSQCFDLQKKSLSNGHHYAIRSIPNWTSISYSNADIQSDRAINCMFVQHFICQCTDSIHTCSSSFPCLHNNCDINYK